MELQLAAVLGSLVLGGAVLVLFFGKWWQPLAATDRRVKELADAVEALLRLRAEVLAHDPAPSSDPVRAWLRRVQEAQDELASIKERHDAGQLYVVRLLQYLFLPTGPVAGLAEQQLKAVWALREQGAAILDAALATPQAPPPLLCDPAELEGLPAEAGPARAYLNEALRFLGDCDAALGVWGAGGVGKTTVLKLVREVCGRVARFDHVLLVAASRDCSVAKLQREVVSVLGLRDAPTEQAQAAGILSFLRDKSFLLLLDGVWERLDLERVGIPQPLGMANGKVRKIIVASRSEAVCADMGCRNKIKMECFNEEDAWSLFEANVGSDTIHGHIQIPALARQVAAECQCLPLALVTVGRAMSNKRTPEEWSNALDTLKASLSNLRDVGMGACHSLTHVTWVQHLPCLESLNLSGCNALTTLLGGVEDGGSAAAEVVVFPRLRVLALLGLQKLEALRVEGECAFPELRRLQTRGCPRLKRILMRPERGQQGTVRIECDKNWWNALQWAGEDVKACFVPVV